MSSLGAQSSNGMPNGLGERRIIPSDDPSLGFCNDCQRPIRTDNSAHFDTVTITPRNRFTASASCAHSDNYSVPGCIRKLGGTSVASPRHTRDSYQVELDNVTGCNWCQSYVEKSTRRTVGLSLAYQPVDIDPCPQDSAAACRNAPGALDPTPSNQLAVIQPGSTAGSGVPSTSPSDRNTSPALDSSYGGSYGGYSGQGAPNF